MKKLIYTLVFALTVLFAATGYSQQPPAPCHPNQTADQDGQTVGSRGDVASLPAPLKDRLVLLAKRPHSTLPIQAYSEAENPSQLFQYYLLDTNGFEPNTFTTIFPGVNDGVAPTAANQADCGLPTLGSVRVVVEPKPGLPIDPKDPGAFIDIFTDIDGLFVINNESGWYEGWMIHDLVVPEVGGVRTNGRAEFGAITSEDAKILKHQGSGQNVPGNTFTLDGNAVRLPGSTDHFPDQQTNVVPLQVSMGAYNCLQQSDCHAYWEFNQYTDWVHPLYELPVAGGLEDRFGDAPDTFEDGEIGAIQSIIPGSGPKGIQNSPQTYGDNPNFPRDADRALNAEDENATIDEHKETRLRFLPSGLANEILLDVYARRASFEPGTKKINKRLDDAYAYEISLIDLNNDGVVDFVEGDLEGTSDHGQSNDRLYLPAIQFNRFAVTREINDGLLAPRFAPSQRAWVMTGTLVSVNPTVSASTGRDSDDR